MCCRLHKDVALISLANVLHRSRFSHEAAVVVHAALDVSKELNVNHFTLGNIYAVSITPRVFCHFRLVVAVNSRVHCIYFEKYTSAQSVASVPLNTVESRIFDRHKLSDRKTEVA